MTIKCTSFLHAQYMVFHPLVFPYLPGSDIDCKEIQYNIQFIKRLIPYLKRYDVKLCLENIYDWKVLDEQKSIRLVHYSYPRNLKRLVDDIDSEYVGICLDTGHMHIAKENIYDAIKIFGDKLWTLHIHDCNGEKDDHFPMHSGTIDWEGVKKGLEEINFKGVYNLEIKPVSHEENYYLSALKYSLALFKD